MNDRADSFNRHRSHLTSVAYRMLGTLDEAEDVVQDAWLRWQGADTDTIRNARAWLTTVVTRLAIDHLRAAKRRREDYVGPWLPEPVIDMPLTDAQRHETPEESAERADEISLALLAILEQLGAEERAAFLLRETFDYDYDELAGVLGKSEAACRQLVSRAKKRIADGRPRFTPDPAAHRRLAAAFAEAALSGDAAQLAALMADDIRLWSDGGGQVRAALRVLEGPQEVAYVLLSVLSRSPSDMEIRECLVNGLPAYFVEQQGEPFMTVSFEVADDRITAIYIVRNPDKLAHVPLH